MPWISWPWVFFAIVTTNVLLAQVWTRICNCFKSKHDLDEKAQIVKFSIFNSQLIYRDKDYALRNTKNHGLTPSP